MFATLLTLLALSSDPGNALPADAADALHASKTGVLYSLEPWAAPGKGDPTLHGVKVLGKTQVTGESYSIAAGEFEAVTKRSERIFAACFDPRHAIRVVSGGHEFEFLLCYACHQMEVYRDGKSIALLGAAGSGRTLNGVLVAANVPVSKSYDEDAELARAKQQEAADRRWDAATPDSLKPVSIESQSLPFESDEHIAQMAVALAKEYPNTDSRILALYRWYGSGAGPWSGFPANEDVAEKLLLTHSTETLIAALESTEMTETQMEGAARLFGGWTFSHERPGDLAELSDALKARLLAHSLINADDDKRGRAMRAFGKQK